MLVWAYRVVPPEAQPQILDNLIYGNRAADGGAGIAMVGASPEIRRNVVARNYTSGFGGGFGCWTTESAKICSPTIANNLIFENSANFKDVGALLGGGGIFASGHGLDGRAIAFGVSAPLVEDNVIAANGAVEKGGGIALVDSDIQAATILNNTIFANNGSAVYWSQTFPTVANNIVAFNTWGLERENEGATAATVLSNDVYGNAVQATAANYKGIADQTGLGGNISADPRLVDYATGRFHIQSNSPCIGAGNAAYAGTGRTDIDGQARVQGGAIDIGADESDGTQWDATIPVVHVLPTGDDAHDGLAWATAVKTVTAGIAAAQAYGAEVWVGAGTYVERFWLPAWVHLYGGFAGTETTRAARAPRLHETILDGDGTPNVVFSALAGHLVSALDGFTVRNGGVYTGGAIPPPNRPGGRGGGVDCNVSSPLIANNVVARNSLGDPFTVTDSTGAGLGLYGSYSLVAGNTFTDNEVLESTGQGGAILISSGAPLISGNTISANHARYGAAIYAVKARPAIVGNTITQNSHYLQTPLYMGSPEGAVDIWLCQDVDIERNTVSGNVAFTGAGITVQSTFQGRIADNVVAGNVARDSSGGGGIGGGVYVEIVQQPTGTLSVVGNTIVGNTASDSFLGDRAPLRVGPRGEQPRRLQLFGDLAASRFVRLDDAGLERRVQHRGQLHQPDRRPDRPLDRPVVREPRRRRLPPRLRLALHRRGLERRRRRGGPRPRRIAAGARRQRRRRRRRGHRRLRSHRRPRRRRRVGLRGLRAARRDGLVGPDGRRRRRHRDRQDAPFVALARDAGGDGDRLRPRARRGRPLPGRRGRIRDVPRLRHRRDLVERHGGCDSGQGDLLLGPRPERLRPRSVRSAVERLAALDQRVPLRR